MSKIANKGPNNYLKPTVCPNCKATKSFVYIYLRKSDLRKKIGVMCKSCNAYKIFKGLKENFKPILITEQLYNGLKKLNW